MITPQTSHLNISYTVSLTLTYYIHSVLHAKLKYISYPSYIPSNDISLQDDTLLTHFYYVQYSTLAWKGDTLHSTL